MSALGSLEERVWQKGGIIENADPDVWRTDDCNALMYRDHYAKDSEYGWEIDHITPQSKDGSDDISNLRPLHWLNNKSRKAGPLTCPVKWEDKNNVATCPKCGNHWTATGNTCPECGTII